jgi:hypothetical protein
MRFGFVGPSYTTASAVAHEECINFFAETLEATSAVAADKQYGGAGASGLRSYFGTPGLSVFATLPESPVRGGETLNGRVFHVAGTKLCETLSNGTFTVRGTIANDGQPVSIAKSNIELLIVSASKAYCYTLATNVLVEVTSSLAGVPMQVKYSDGYFIIALKNSNQFQMSGILDGATWPGLQVNAVSVFPENIVAIEVNHRELWVFGARHAQPYQDTGSDEIFDVIGGALIEKGCGATFAPCLLDNSVFWIDEDDRGGRTAWRAQGYTPQRISTHAVETDLATYASISGMTTYAYQDGGHLFWVLYVPGAQWSWVYDVAEGLWHKRAEWIVSSWVAHYSQNHVYAFGKHLVGDWNSGNLYEMSLANLTDNGTAIRRLRQAPTVIDEMQWVYHAEMTVDVQTGTGTASLTDGNGNPRQPQAILQWSDNRGQTWGNEHLTDCGYIGEYNTRVVWRRLGRSRYRVYRFVVTDPVSWVICDAYLRVVSDGS